MTRKKRTQKPGVRIRMYRLGVGDCFLVRFARKRGGDFKMLIDCGVHQSQAGGSEKIRKAVEDILKETGSKLDVLVVTHEHWDHVSGFAQAEDLFDKMTIGEVWTSWAEDSDDGVAKTLKDKRKRAARAVGFACERMDTLGVSERNELLTGLQGFLGDTTGTKLAAVGAIVKRLAQGGKTVKYLAPEHEPFKLSGTNARVYVLGPPRSKELIGKSAPSAKNSEVYLDAFSLDDVEVALCASNGAPFPRDLAVPLAATAGMSFFQRHYWSDVAANPVEEREELRQDWRRIDTAWLDPATSLALKLDEDTNNTSLVLAIELGKVGGPVLLFAADAQVGNWLSWQSAEWKVDGHKVTGPDLLRRTVVYKVGHHASHNATLKEQGLELMDSLELALVTTDSEMAKKVKWGTLPWPKLLTRLAERTKSRVIRTDEDHDGKADGFNVKVNELFYEIAF